MLNNAASLPVHSVLQSRIQQSLWAGWLGLALVSLPAPGLALTVEEIQIPGEKSSGWVADKANLLSPETERAINRLATNLAAKTGAKIAVVTVPETKPSATPKEFATTLLGRWYASQRGVYPQVLLLISKADRHVEIERGFVDEALLSEAKVGTILSQNIIPRFKQGDFGGGTFAVTQAVVQTLKQSPAQEKWQLAYLLLVGAVMFIGLLIYIYERVREEMIDNSEHEAREPYPRRKPVISDSNELREKESNIERSQAIGQVETKSASSDHRLSPNTSEQSTSQWLRWEEYFVHHDPMTQPQLKEASASVSLCRQEGEETILFGLKYFSNPQEAKGFARVIGSFLQDALFELDLELVCQTPDATLVWPDV